MLKALIVVLLWATAGFAADYYVDNMSGNDQYNGLATTRGEAGVGPFATIKMAIDKAEAGDTIHLNNTGIVYRQSVDFYGHPGGLAEKPLVFDGHNAVLSGAEICSPEGWTEENGVLHRADIVGNVVVNGRLCSRQWAYNSLELHEVCYEPAAHARLFYRFSKERTPQNTTFEVVQEDGQVVTLAADKWQRSNSRLPGVMRYNGLKIPRVVRVNGKHCELVQAAQRLAPGHFTTTDGTLYFRPHDGLDWPRARIECVVRGNGVQLSGNTQHVVVRNLTVRHVSNDGYNIHGDVRNVTFNNCHAHDCYDEGFSAHGACETVLDGAVYERCDNGIANVNHAGFSVTRNVVIRNSRSVGFLIQSRGQARHELKNAILVDNPAQLVAADLSGENILIWSSTAKGSGTSIGRAVSLQAFTIGPHDAAIQMGKGANANLENGRVVAGRVGIRAAQPFAGLTVQRVLFGANISVQYGASYPWKTPSLAEWLAMGSRAKKVTDTQIVDGLGANVEGELVEGCKAELMSRMRQLPSVP